MEKQRDKTPAPESTVDAEATKTPLAPIMGIPEEADEIIEIVDDDAPAEVPAPAARRTEPDFPEALGAHLSGHRYRDDDHDQCHNVLLHSSQSIGNGGHRQEPEGNGLPT